MATFKITTVDPEGVESQGSMEVSDFNHAAYVVATAMLSFIGEGRRDEFPENYVVEQTNLINSHERDENWEFTMARVDGTTDTFTYSS